MEPIGTPEIRVRIERDNPWWDDATPEIPYGYYTLLRLVACGVFALASFITQQKKHTALPWVYGLLAILFNPFFPIYLTKELWIYMDIGGALLLLFTSKTIIENDPKPLMQSSPTALTKGALAGSDYEHAIPVNSVEQEYAWIETNHPNARPSKAYF